MEKLKNPGGCLDRNQCFQKVRLWTNKIGYLQTV